MNGNRSPYRFAAPAGPWRSFYAWTPVRTWDGVWAWLRPMRRRRIVTHAYLPGPDGTWWQVDYPEDAA